MQLYTEEEVVRLLETQRGNCYVAVLTQTKDEKIASLATLAPEPAGGNWKKQNTHNLPLRLYDHWDTYSIIEKLIEACNILLHKKDYDGHGWELIDTAKNKAVELLTQIRNKTNMTNTEKLIESQNELIDLLKSQVEQLSIMSKIELGDDVITEIVRLQNLITDLK